MAVAVVLERRDLAGLDVDQVGAVGASANDTAVLGIGHDVVPAAVRQLDPVDDLVLGGECGHRSRDREEQCGKRCSIHDNHPFGLLISPQRQFRVVFAIDPDSPDET